MKKILLLLTISATILSCNNVKKGEFLVVGTAKGIADGKTAIIQKQDEMLGLVPLDTVKIKDGKFELKGKIEEPTICSITIQDIEGQIILIAESEKVTVAVDKDSIFKSKVGGSYNNEEFTKFNEEMKTAQKKFTAQDKAFKEKYKAEIASLQTSQDPAIIEKLNTEYGPIQAEAQKVSKEKMTTYAETHPKAFISVLILDGMFKSPDMDFEKAKKMYDGLDADLKKTKPGKSIKSIIDNYKKPQPTVGPPAAPVAPAQWITDNDFEAKTPDGKTLSLKNAAGKITIIDFWASWCPPCRAENPNLVKIYNEFHSKGLNIIGVSLDDDDLKWKNAIRKDKLTWSQVSTLKGWSCPIAKKYGVESIPAPFIIDANGKIIAKDLHGDELRNKIAELLK